MRSIVLAGCISLFCADAMAISRHDPTAMSCDRVQATVAAEGATILRYRSATTPGLPLYDRYVADERYCELGEMKARAYVPSADLKACPVFRCKKVEYEHRFRRFILPD